MLTHLDLQISAGHVQTHGVAKDMVAGLLDRNVFSRLANRHHQLNFIVEVAGQGGVGDRHRGVCRHRHHRLRIIGFAKKEGRFAVGVKTHFSGVGRVVSANAIHTSNRKRFRLAGDGQAHHRVRREDVIHGQAGRGVFSIKAERLQEAINSLCWL